MIRWIRDIYARRRLDREQEALRILKARYHTFRAVLHSNERALELISSFDEALLKRSGLSTILEELLAVTFELVDGLNRLSDNRYPALYGAHDRLARTTRQVTARLDSEGDAEILAISLEDAATEQARSIGGKAAFLGEMIRSGMPVPPGFVMTSLACRRFLERSGLDESIMRILRPLDAGAGDPSAAAREIRALINAAQVPDDIRSALADHWRAIGSPPVSVRSSALVEDNPAHSFAGQFTSVLNVCSEDALIQAYKDVVASNFGARPLTYRRQAGLPLDDFSMAAIVQTMVDARAAGVLFTLNPSDPENGRMLLSAVRGLGTQAVGGSSPADVFQPLRDDPADVLSIIADKEGGEVPAEGGGLTMATLSEQERAEPALIHNEISALLRWGLLAEVLFGAPQDMEWAVDQDGDLVFLQSRSIRLQGKAIRAARRITGEKLVADGVCAASGRAFGKARVLRDADDLTKPLPEGPVVLVLHQSLVDAAQLMPRLEGVVVELGNPTDHLSCVAREYGVPMITGAPGAVDAIPEGELVIVDADDHVVTRVPPDVVASMPQRKREHAPHASLSARARELRDLIVPLNLTDAYGPTFSISECRSLHDIVRFCHEKTLLSLFHAGDEAVEEADSLVHWLDDVPLQFLIIDLGGGLAPDVGRRISVRDVLSAPLQALCEGMNTPGLRWRAAPPVLSVSELMSRSMIDGGGERPLGNQNYALITRDYLNLNARVDFHFAMVDSVCGPNQQENFVRFRFKGGGTAAVQRERRAEFIGRILRANGYATDTQGDLVTASLTEVPGDDVREQLHMLGRLLGFSRLMDGAMVDDDAPRKAAEAFLEGDLALEHVDFQA